MNDSRREKERKEERKKERKKGRKKGRKKERDGVCEYCRIKSHRETERVRH